LKGAFIEMRFFYLLVFAASLQPAGLDQLRRDFANPPVDTRPHTRWWWMGNALRNQDIDFQLDQMRAAGIGGVEQISMEAVYERGNVEFLSDEYFARLKHAISEAKRRGMEFSLNFGGPGWIWGGEWVPKADRNKNMVASMIEVRGPRLFRGELPLDVVRNPRNPTYPLERISAEDRVLAVVAGETEDLRLRESSLVDLTARVRGRHIEWQVPAGRWRLMVFWQVSNGGACVDHLSKAAMERYCDHIGRKFVAAFGDELGKTVESVFMDSFEVPVYRNGLYWSNGLLEEFRKHKGYDLTRYLPALWWDVDELSPKIRYDVNEFLHQVGIEAFFKTFIGWAERHGVKARIQPYGFVTDILEGAGMAHIPEMEITPGEKDAVPWFDTRVGPRTYTPSGAHLYGRNVVSVEAYTYMHWQQARDTMEELKIASDGFLRAGANKFYNHGYTGTPEREFAPTRRFSAEMLISHVNIWWPFYRHLSDYVARGSAVMRYGRPVADIAVYSPLANQWTLDVLNSRRWTRDFDWSDLGKLIWANGYDFDLINDDVLQHRAMFDGGSIRVRDLDYRVLVLPNIQAMPLESLRRIEEYVKGGGVVVALEQKPQASTGLAGHVEHDAQARAISDALFRDKRYGAGHTYFLQKVMERRDMLDWKSSVFDPFVNALREHVAPDLAIDFVREALRENTGLMFAHRTAPDADIYFIANMQDRPLATRVAFRVAGKAPQAWNAIDGQVRPLEEFDIAGNSTTMPLRLAPFESTIVIFSGVPDPAHVRQSDFREVLSQSEALADRNGDHLCDARTIRVEGIPAPYQVAGAWHLTLGDRQKQMLRLESWTTDPATKHFSGTGVYTTAFDLPAAYITPDLRIELSLGDLGNIGEVEVNGKPAGVIWMRGQTLDVTRLLQAGANSMRVKVTNTLINRVSAWKTAPPLPPDLAAVYGRGLHDGSKGMRDLYGFSPLPRSGLLGPVTLTPLKKVQLR
jgi:hypothetical protein